MWKWNGRLINGINSIYGGNLDAYFKTIINIKYTAEMEEMLDDISEGKNIVGFGATYNGYDKKYRKNNRNQRA